MALCHFLAQTIVQDIGAKQERGVDVRVLDEVIGILGEHIGAKLAAMFEDGEPVIWESICRLGICQSEVHWLEGNHS